MGFEFVTGGVPITPENWLTKPRSPVNRYPNALPWQASPGLSGLGAVQHMNSELPGKVAQVDGQISALKGLLAQIENAISQYGPILNTEPGGISVLASANSAQSAVQGAIDQLASSRWNGENFNSFQGSTDAWNHMDQALVATSDVLVKNRGVVPNLAANAGRIQQASVVAEQSRQTAGRDAANKVTNALFAAQNMAAQGNYAGALAALQDPDVVQAANIVGRTSDIQAAISSLAGQQMQIKQKDDIQKKQGDCSAAGGTWMGTYCDMTQANLLQRQVAQQRAQCSAAGGTWNEAGQFCDMSAKLVSDRQAQIDAQNLAAQQAREAESAKWQAQLQLQQQQFQQQQKQFEAQMSAQAAQACYARGGTWDGGACNLESLNAQQEAQRQIQLQQAQDARLMQFLPYVAGNPGAMAQILGRLFGIDAGSMAAQVPGGDHETAGIMPGGDKYSTMFGGDERF